MSAETWIKQLSTKCQTLCLTEPITMNPLPFIHELRKINKDTGNALNLGYQNCGSGCDGNLSATAIKQLVQKTWIDKPYAEKIGWCRNDLVSNRTQASCMKEASVLSQAQADAEAAFEWLPKLTGKCRELCLRNPVGFDKTGLETWITTVNDAGAKLSFKHCTKTCNGHVNEKAKKEITAIAPIMTPELAGKMGWCHKSTQKKCERDVWYLANTGSLPPKPKSDPWIVDVTPECQTLCLSEENSGGRKQLDDYLVKLNNAHKSTKLNLNVMEFEACHDNCGGAYPPYLHKKAFDEWLTALEKNTHLDENIANTIGWCGSKLRNKCAIEANKLAGTYPPHAAKPTTASGKVQTPAPTGSSPAPPAKPALDASTLYPALIGLLSSMLAFILFVR